MRIPSGVTDQYIYFVAVDATDLKTRETGFSTWTVYRSRNGAAAATMTTPTINETDSVNMPGVYELLLDEDMTIGAGNDSEEMVFHITHAGMAPVTRTIELYRPKITAGYTLGTESNGDLTKVNSIAAAAIANATFAADVGSTTYANNIIALAVRKVLDELNLDHLLKVTTGVAADGDLEIYVVAGTVMSHVLSVGADVTTYKPSTDSLQAIRDAGLGSLAGSYSCTLTIRTTGGTAIPGCRVWLSTSSSGSPTFGSAQYTNASGQATWWLDNGTYYVFASGAGYIFANDEDCVVSSATMTQNYDYGTAIVGDGSLSSGLTGGIDAFLVRVADRIRNIVDEPEINDKYTDTRLITMIEEAYAQILQDVQRSSSTEIHCYYTFDYDANINVYQLPATCGTVVSIAVRNDDGTMSYLFQRRNRLNSYGVNLTIEHNIIRFQPSAAIDGETIEVVYIPDGTTKFFKATTSTHDSTTDPNTITASVVDLGYRDTRTNAYLGSLLRILTPAYAQDRIITVQASNVYSVGVAFSPALVGEVEFEIVPELPLNLDMVIAYKVALTIAGNEGNVTRQKTVGILYSDAMRTISLALANKDRTSGQVGTGDGALQRRGSLLRRPRI